MDMTVRCIQKYIAKDGAIARAGTIARLHGPNAMSIVPCKQHCAILLAAAAMTMGSRAVRADDSSAALRANYAATSARLADSPFHRPLYLDSSEAHGRFEGSIHARIDQSFERVRSTLTTPADWCGVLLLMPNIADCRPSDDKGVSTLSVGLVRKFDDKPEQAMPVRFSFSTQQSDDGVQIQLQAPDGPLGTHDYRITLEAIPLAADQSFVYLRYAYEYGWAANMAGKAYLASSGSDKVGFSVRGHKPDGSPQYIGGLRGAVERNAMRCYLAIESHLAAAAQSQTASFDTSLQLWLHAIAQFPRQLKEEDPAAYRAAKQRDSQHGAAPNAASQRQ